MHTTSQIGALLGTSSDVRSGNELLEDVNINRVTPNYSEIRAFNVASGRFLKEADETHRSPVCFIGADVAKKFFYNVDPIQSIRAGSHSYGVVGVSTVIGSALANPRTASCLFRSALTPRNGARSAIPSCFSSTETPR